MNATVKSDRVEIIDRQWDNGVETLFVWSDISLAKRPFAGIDADEIFPLVFIYIRAVIMAKTVYKGFYTALIEE